MDDGTGSRYCIEVPGNDEHDPGILEDSNGDAGEADNGSVLGRDEEGIGGVSIAVLGVEWKCGEWALG